MGRLDERWVVDNPPSSRYPLYTRANVGEVFPDPVTPLTWTMAGVPGAEQGWRDAWDRFGAIDTGEYDPDNIEVLGVFGGYCYLNVSLSRVFGARVPGLTPEAIDFSFFGTQPGVPPYQAREGDESPEHAQRAGATLQWVMTTDSLPELLDDQQAMERLRAERPDLSSLSEAELLARTRELMGTWFRRLFGQHIHTSFSALTSAGVIAQVCEALGDPTLAMRLVAGLGGVDSAAPSWAMWDLGRLVAGSPALTAQFDQGVEGLCDRLRADGDGDSDKFVQSFDHFLYAFGSRGPNEWEMRSPSWETTPQLALAAIDRMRLAGDQDSPQGHHEALAADREQLTPSLLEAITDPEVKATFGAALHSAAVFFPGRERTKTTVIRQIHECRVAMNELGRRMVEAGHFDEVGDYAMLRDDEFDAFLADPPAFRDVIRDRRSWCEELASLEPPFLLVGQPTPPSSWARRGSTPVERAVAGDVLPGIPGCPGKATGRARILSDSSDPGALQPGDVLVAPITDPSWTPLFVPAAAVVVDVGSQVSHAVIVSRELGIPCVVSVTDATRRLADGDTVTVDGTAGTVTVS
ncbi:MAG: PEP-utilizing enzyme [Actinomycetota bacterium]|nr:PEP-utilizing enzyme [Actinomycetota bacterium]